VAANSRWNWPSTFTAAGSSFTAEVESSTEAVESFTGTESSTALADAGAAAARWLRNTVLHGGGGGGVLHGGFFSGSLLSLSGSPLSLDVQRQPLLLVLGNPAGEESAEGGARGQGGEGVARGFAAC
jgi:hypothetical protein